MTRIYHTIALAAILAVAMLTSLAAQASLSAGGAPAPTHDEQRLASAGGCCCDGGGGTCV